VQVGENGKMDPYYTSFYTYGTMPETIRIYIAEAVFPVSVRWKRTEWAFDNCWSIINQTRAMYDRQFAFSDPYKID